MDKRLRINEVISINFDKIEVEGNIRFIWYKNCIVASFHKSEADIIFVKKLESFVKFELLYK